MLRIGKRREEYFEVAQLLCLKRNIENLSAIQEKAAISLGNGATRGFSANRKLSLTAARQIVEYT
jgi:hypothetical protein